MNNITFQEKVFREKIMFLLKNDKEDFARELMLLIAQEQFINQEDFLWLYQFFSPIYDELFYDMMFGKILFKAETKEVLEELALPFFAMNEQEKRKWGKG